MCRFIQTGQQWRFRSEQALEEVVWRHLPELLAVDSAGHLLIIELKNTEDRYIVQQLTRYYDALNHTDEFPFSINTAHPRVLAIALSLSQLPEIALSYLCLLIAVQCYESQRSTIKTESPVLRR